MPIGQGDYGRGGQIGGASRSSQKRAPGASAKYQAQDARAYLSGDDQLDYDNQLGYLNKGYSGNMSFTVQGQRKLSAADKSSQANYSGAADKLSALRRKAAESMRSRGGMVQGAGQAKAGRTSGAMPGVGKGQLFKQLEIDQGWMKDKPFMQYDFSQKGSGGNEFAKRDFSKPWLFKDADF